LPSEIEIEDPDSIKFDIECGIQAQSVFEDTAAAARRALTVTWYVERNQSGSKQKIAAPLPQIGKRSLMI